MTRFSRAASTISFVISVAQLAHYAPLFHV